MPEQNTARALFTGAQAARVMPTKPKVVCGMVVIPVEPAIDPGFVIRPKDDRMDYKIRRIPPLACAE